MESSGFYMTKMRAQTIVTSLSDNDNILEEIENNVVTWTYTSDTDLAAIKNDLGKVAQHIRNELFGKTEKVADLLPAIHCLVHNAVHYILLPLLWEKFAEEDDRFFEKCRIIWSKRISLQTNQLPLSEFNSLPFTAAVVELSMLDTYQSPLEKLNCLCTTYDMIYAELKSSLISLISKYSDNDLEIPVINDDEVIPMLQFVIIKSKLLHLCSNLYFADNFGKDFIENDKHLLDIIKKYNTAAARIMDINQNSFNTHSQKGTKGLDILEAIQTVTDTENSTERTTSTVKDDYKKRYLNLIAMSTDANYIPMTPLIKF